LEESAFQLFRQEKTSVGMVANSDWRKANRGESGFQLFRQEKTSVGMVANSDWRKANWGEELMVKGYWWNPRSNFFRKEKNQ
jgi:hypothetical protein